MPTEELDGYYATRAEEVVAAVTRAKEALLDLSSSEERKRMAMAAIDAAWDALEDAQLQGYRFSQRSQVRTPSST
jgi:hypothetical protein